MIQSMGAGAARAKPTKLQGYVTFRVAGQWLGVSVARVQEVLTERAVSCVPLAPPGISGFMSLRGQMVTAIDLRSRLGLPAHRAAGGRMKNVVVQDEGELFSLVVDEIGDVVVVRAGQVEATPATLTEHWRACCDGVVRLPDGVLGVLDVERLLSIDGPTRR